MNNTLSVWLNNEMATRQWSQSDLARKSGLHRAVISKILSENTKPTPETCQALAEALKLPIEQVYRAANLLPSHPEQDELVARAEYLLQSFKTEQYRQIALSMLENLVEQEERAGVKKPVTGPLRPVGHKP